MVDHCLLWRRLAPSLSSPGRVGGDCRIAVLVRIKAQGPRLAATDLYDARAATDRERSGRAVEGVKRERPRFGASAGVRATVEVLNAQAAAPARAAPAVRRDATRQRRLLRKRLRRARATAMNVLMLYLALAALGWAPHPMGPWSDAARGPSSVARSLLRPSMVGAGLDGRRYSAPRVQVAPVAAVGRRSSDRRDRRLPVHEQAGFLATQGRHRSLLR